LFFIFCRRRSKTQYGKLCEKQISVVRSGFLGEKMELYVLKCAIIVVFRGSAANPRWDIVALDNGTRRGTDHIVGWFY